MTSVLPSGGKFLFIYNLPDSTYRISEWILNTENSRISGKFKEITISIHKISKNVFLKPGLALKKTCSIKSAQ
jgi:hypothetical protein